MMSFWGHQIVLPSWQNHRALMINALHNQTFEWYHIINTYRSQWHESYIGQYSQFQYSSHLEIIGDIDPGCIIRNSDHADPWFVTSALSLLWG
jgi:hypothetical protein